MNEEIYQEIFEKLSREFGEIIITGFSSKDSFSKVISFEVEIPQKEFLPRKYSGKAYLRNNGSLGITLKGKEKIGNLNAEVTFEGF